MPTPDEIEAYRAEWKASHANDPNAPTLEDFIRAKLKDEGALDIPEPQAEGTDE